MLDLDGDRKVTWEEYKTFVEYHGEKAQRRDFDAEDPNSDGQIEWNEFSGCVSVSVCLCAGALACAIIECPAGHFVVIFILVLGAACAAVALA